jgi:hypothetical protein
MSLAPARYALPLLGALAPLLGACAHAPIPPPTDAALLDLARRSPVGATLPQVAPLLQAAVAAMSAHLHHDPERLPLTEAAIDACFDPTSLTTSIAARLRAALPDHDLRRLLAWHDDPAHDRLLTHLQQPLAADAQALASPHNPRREADLQTLANHYNPRATLRRFWVSLYSNAALIALASSPDEDRDREALRLVVAGAVRRTGIERQTPHARLHALRLALRDSSDEDIAAAAASWSSPLGVRYQAALWGAYTDTLDEGADCAVALLR